MKTASERFDSLLEASRESDAYWAEKALIEYTEEIIARMERQNVTRSELARRLGKRPAYVTKLLRGDNNFTFETVVKIARALGMEFVPHMKPVGWQTRWMDYSPAKSKAQAVSLAVRKQEYSRNVETELTGEEDEVFAIGA
ncbi:helix-turn-helix domain-containing protein [Pontiella sp.]|uniref:helix-turn-helix domain-containing protein n=1 Tax=Pontiella sp. TaxID=2837462 RepID=UPI00356A6ACC